MATPNRIRRLRFQKKTVTVTDDAILKAQAKLSTIVQALQNNKITFRNAAKALRQQADMVIQSAVEMEKKVESLQAHIDMLESAQMDLGLSNVTDEEIAKYLKARREGTDPDNNLMIGIEALAQSMGLQTESNPFFVKDQSGIDYPDDDDEIPF